MPTRKNFVNRVRLRRQEAAERRKKEMGPDLDKYIAKKLDAEEPIKCSRDVWMAGLTREFEVINKAIR